MANLIYKKVEEHVTGLYEKMHTENLIFHNLEHTQNVVHRTKEIAAHYNVLEKDMLILYVAAWFHDTGYLFTKPEQHEEKSVEIMKKFIADYEKDPGFIKETEDCILVTKPPRNANNILQEIICDADTYHFGTKEFKETNKRVREEYILIQGEISKKEWDERAVEMLEAHKYFTSYCQNLLDETKKDNIKKLKKNIMKKKEKNDDNFTMIETNSLTTKGIQTMLRLTSENHLKLSDMADNKANILISVNSIIISVILGVLLRKLPEAPYLAIPSIIFLLVAVATIVISILATRPKLSSGTFSNQDVLDKKTNLLFFGNFHKASYDEYNSAMRQMMRDPNYLYGSLVKDIYQLGVVLGRKYKLVHLAYNIFMVGIVVAVLAFAVAALFYSGNTPVTPVSSGSPL